MKRNHTQFWDKHFSSLDGGNITMFKTSLTINDLLFLVLSDLTESPKRYNSFSQNQTHTNFIIYQTLNYISWGHFLGFVFQFIDMHNHSYTSDQNNCFENVLGDSSLIFSQVVLADSSCQNDLVHWGARVAELLTGQRAYVCWRTTVWQKLCYFASFLCWPI